MNERQRRFADEYIINIGNAFQAALKAGYSEKYAMIRPDILVVSKTESEVFDEWENLDIQSG